MAPLARHAFRWFCATAALLGSLVGCGPRASVPPASVSAPAAEPPPARWETAGALGQRIAAELARQCAAGIVYRDGYHDGGEPPAGEGVCTDVVVRAYRAAGVDLRSLVAQDVARSPGAYDISRPDRDIDHRRCRNLIVFFGRHARRLPGGRANEARTGDVVFWSTRRNGRADHVGVVVRGQAGVRVAHHWPGCPVLEEDVRGRWPEVGRFRWPTPSGE